MKIHLDAERYDSKKQQHKGYNDRGYLSHDLVLARRGCVMTGFPGVSDLVRSSLGGGSVSLSEGESRVDAVVEMTIAIVVTGGMG